ncbi:unnamed protein product [Knipowitschia caucasica]|uniref:Proline-rich protein 14 n=1 Tax=Knipowitschia caucasica TaxID=637954 RepID=A0AAV2M1R8_KNICA
MERGADVRSSYYGPSSSGPSQRPWKKPHPTAPSLPSPGGSSRRDLNQGTQFSAVLQESGTRLFYQVKPSGRRRVLKMVPGRPVQTHTPIPPFARTKSSLVSLQSKSHLVSLQSPPVHRASGQSLVTSDLREFRRVLGRDRREGRSELVLRLPQRPEGPSVWVVQEKISLPPAEEVQGVEGVEEVQGGPDCAVVMWDDRIFFRVQKELVDLCTDEEEEEEEQEEVMFVGCSPAQTAQEKPGVTLAPGGLSTPTVSSREGPKSRGQDLQTPDLRLRQSFGITSELRVRLPRLNSLAPPLDYTQPIEEDFLCDVAPPHAQDCPQVEATSSRVGRTRKRTRCPCCSPAALLHHAHKRRPKPGDRRPGEGPRRGLRLDHRDPDLRPEHRDPDLRPEHRDPDQRPENRDSDLRPGHRDPETQTQTSVGSNTFQKVTEAPPPSEAPPPTESPPPTEAPPPSSFPSEALPPTEATPLTEAPPPSRFLSEALPPTEAPPPTEATPLKEAPPPTEAPPPSHMELCLHRDIELLRKTLQQKEAELEALRNNRT